MTRETVGHIHSEASFKLLPILMRDTRGGCIQFEAVSIKLLQIVIKTHLEHICVEPINRDLHNVIFEYDSNYKVYFRSGQTYGKLL